MPPAAKKTHPTPTAPAKSPLPNGWKWMRFDQIAVNVSDRIDDPKKAGVEHYVGLEHLDSDSLIIRRWGTPDDVEAQKLRFQSGDIIFGKRRAYQRKVGVAEFAGICSAHAFVFRGNSKHIVPDLLPYFMQTDAFMERAVAISKGSLSPTINWGDLARQEFALPNDSTEQCRIAELLRAADKAVEGWRTVATSVDAIRNSLIAGMSSRSRAEITPGILRPGWSYEPLGNRYSIQLGKMMSPDAMNGNAKRAYLRNANVQWNRLDLEDVAEMDFDPKEVAKFVLKFGDILACEGRHVGKSAIWRDEIPGACFQKALHRLRPKSKVDLPEYLLLCLWDCELTGRFKQLIGETTIPHLPAERFRELHMAFPPLEEQEEFVKMVRVVDSNRSAATTHANNARCLLEKLMNQLLTPSAEMS